MHHVLSSLEHSSFGGNNKLHEKLITHPDYNCAHAIYKLTVLAGNGGLEVVQVSCA